MHGHHIKAVIEAQAFLSWRALLHTTRGTGADQQGRDGAHEARSGGDRHQSGQGSGGHVQAQAPKWMRSATAPETTAGVMTARSGAAAERAAQRNATAGMREASYTPAKRCTRAIEG